MADNGSIRDRPVRRTISRTGSFSRNGIRLMMFKNPMLITPLPPAAHRFGGRVTWVKSQWKLCACLGQFQVEINRSRCLPDDRSSC